MALVTFTNTKEPIDGNLPFFKMPPPLEVHLRMSKYDIITVQDYTIHTGIVEVVIKICSDPRIDLEVIGALADLEADYGADLRDANLVTDEDPSMPSKKGKKPTPNLSQSIKLH